jgi:hypothetical protein
MLRNTLQPMAHPIRSAIGTAGIADRMSALEAAMRQAAGARLSVAYCEVLATGYAEPLARHDVLTGESRVSLDFDLNGTTFGLQFRCVSTGGEGFSVLRKVGLEEHVR